MPIQASIKLVKDRLASGLTITKPALDLLAERLGEAARFSKVGGNPHLEKPKERVSMPALINRHGRIETAMMCMVVENVVSTFLVHHHGVRGAIDRTLPLLSTRAMSTFDTAYDFLLGQAHTLVDAAAKSIDDRVSPSLKTPAGAVVAGVDRSLRLALGEDYVVDTRAYVAAIPERAAALAKVKVVKAMAIKDHSRLASLLFSGVVHSTALGIFGASSLFAFTHVFTIGVDEEDVEGADDHGWLACDLSITTTTTYTAAEDTDTSDDTLDVVVEDVVRQDKVMEVEEGEVADGVEEAGEGEKVAMEAIADHAIEADSGMEEDDDDDEIIIIPSSLRKEDVVEDFSEEEEPREDELEEQDEDIETALAVAASLAEVKGVERRPSEDIAVWEASPDNCGLEEGVLEQMFDDEMLLELAIIEQYQGGSEEEEDGIEVVDEAIKFCGLEAKKGGLSAETLLELAIMEQYQQDGEVVFVEVVAEEALEDEVGEEEEEPFVEEVAEEEQEGGAEGDRLEEERYLLIEEIEVEEMLIDLEDEVEASTVFVDEDAEEAGALDGCRGEEDDVDGRGDSYPTRDELDIDDLDFQFQNGEYMTMYDELRWAGERMSVYDLCTIPEEDEPEEDVEEGEVRVQEDTVRAGPVHQLARCSSMPCLSSWRSESGAGEWALMPSVSFEFSARESHAKSVEDVVEAESVVEDKEEGFVRDEEVLIDQEAAMEQETVDVEALAGPGSSSAVAVSLVREPDVRSKVEKESTSSSILTPGVLSSSSSAAAAAASSKSTLTPFAYAFVPKGTLVLSAMAGTTPTGSTSTSIRHDSDEDKTDKENKLPFPLRLQGPPPAHWTPARGVLVTISAPRPKATGLQPQVKAGNGKGSKPSRRERHLARMGAKGKGKGKEQEQEKAGGKGEGRYELNRGIGVRKDKDLNGVEIE